MKATLQDAAVFFLRRPVWVEYASGGSPTLHEEPLDEEVAMVNDAVRRSSIVIDTVSREAMKVWRPSPVPRHQGRSRVCCDSETLRERVVFCRH